MTPFTVLLPVDTVHAASFGHATEHGSPRGAHNAHTHPQAPPNHTRRVAVAAWRRQCHLHPSIGTLSLAQGLTGWVIPEAIALAMVGQAASKATAHKTQLGGWVFGSTENHLASQIDRHIDSTTAGLGYLVYKGAHDRLARGALAAFPARRGVENAGEADRAFRQFRRKNYVRPCHTTHR